MDNQKRIAYIFEEAKIFLTKDGNYYSYEDKGERVKCHRLTSQERESFIKGFRPRQLSKPEAIEEINWQPIAHSEDKYDKVLILQQLRGCSTRQNA